MSQSNRLNTKLVRLCLSVHARIGRGACTRLSQRGIQVLLAALAALLLLLLPQVRPQPTTPTASVSAQGVAFYNHFFAASTVQAQTMDPAYTGIYTPTNLSAPAGVPFPLGAVTFKNDDPNVLLIGGDGNKPTSKIYAANVIRGPDGHITGFGSTSVFADANGATAGIDGGLAYGPNGVLFYTTYPDSHIGQIKPGSTGPDKLIYLRDLGLLGSAGSLYFVPPGMPGAGRLKILDFGGAWWDATVAPDGSGTFNITLIPPSIPTIEYPEGVIYVTGGNPGFPQHAALVEAWIEGNIYAYDINANSDIIPGTQRLFITGLAGAEGAAIDPITNDFLFSTFSLTGGGDDHVIRVEGFKISAFSEYPNFNVTSTTLPSAVFAGNNLKVSYTLTYAPAATGALPSGFPVSFYVGDPRLGGSQYLGTTTTNALIAPGATGTFTATLDGTGQTVPLNLFLVAGDIGNGSVPFATFTASHFANHLLVPPVITSNGGGATAAVNAAENQSAVTTIIATDANSENLTYSLSGGADSAKFSINATTGVLTFVSTPDFEHPTDGDANNVYDVQVTVSDGHGGSDTQALAVTVTFSAAIEYKLVFNHATNRYEVYMRPTGTASAPNQTLTAQVTLKVPHIAGAGAFAITALTPYAGTTWTVDSPVVAPTEDPTADYLSVQLQTTTNSLSWQAGQEILAFSFQNANGCAGPVSLMPNSDPFNVSPNSANSNPGNQIDVLGLGADPGNDYLGTYGEAAATCAGIEYRLAYNTATSRYEVYMRPNATASAPNQTLTAQVTIKAPHIAGAGAFTVTNVIPASGTQWNTGDVVRAPSEDTMSDYLSVQLQTTTNALSWQAGQEILVFSFQNLVCSGPMSIIQNSDPFNVLPNSVNSNPGNQIDVLSLGADPGNDYLGNYDNPTAVCVPYPDLTISLGQPTPALTAGMTSTLPVTVANIGAGPTTGAITVIVPLPANVSSPASFTSNGWTCTTTGQTVTCTNSGPINAGENRLFSVPVIPAVAAIGTTPTFNASVSTAPEFITGNNNAAPVTANSAVAGGTVILPIKVFLGGAYNTGTGLMSDALRTKSLIPTTEPYTGLSGFTHTNGGGGEQANASVFSVSGNNAIVDWVFVELRNPTTSATVIATRAALVQRDGDVVGLDGVTSLVLPAGFYNQSYAIAVRHRNHLGVMTANPVTLTPTTALIDFTLPASALYGTNAEKTVGSVRVLWSGNANANKNVIYTGPGNDINPILITVLSAPGNGGLNRNYIVTGYNQGDIDLDGRTIAAGPGNDVNPILANVYTHPGNAALAANYIIVEQLP